MEEILGANHIVEILKLGLSGLVFLLTLLTFRLLKIEQGKNNPRENILKSIKSFSRVTLIAALLVGVFGLLEIIYRPTSSHNCDTCIESLETVIELAGSPNQDVESLRGLIRNQIQPCMENIKDD